jgi:RNA polymerase sigma factor (sigma-70 family)
MKRTHSDETNVGLLERIGQNPSDQDAWETFVAYYGPKVRAWCRLRGLQPADADDVTQDVLLRLAHALRKFTYDPSRTFRGWLRIVTEHALSDFFADRKRRPGAGSGMNVTAVFKAKSRVLAFIRREVKRLDGQP